ncbi:MAG TPA: TrmH family RNA methyltransferase [Candidatus Paceibacterota bacterium]|nr:TrmH family RNA methyltransferase [Candidatus Paceibacterota bacterium]
MPKVYLILDNIRSVQNVASIFRTAEGAGVARIFLAGVTPAPTDRFGRMRRDFAKVALGAENLVEWEQVPSAEAAIHNLKGAGVEIIALEQSAAALHFKEVRPTKSFALLLGEETQGLPESTLKLCDIICQIPMRGEKESLNVSVAAGIALFQLLNI